MRQGGTRFDLSHFSHFVINRILTAVLSAHNVGLKTLSSEIPSRYLVHCHVIDLIAK